MGKLSIFLFVLFLFALSVFSIFNQGTVSIIIPFGPIYEVQKFALILLSIAVGVFVAFIFFTIRDTKKFIDNWQYQKKQKQEIKVQELYSRALNSLLAKNEDAAREALEDILKEEPNHIDALLRLGDIAASDEDFQKANAHYQRARELEPKRIETLFALDSLLEKSGRWSEALRYLDEILDIDDANLTAMYRKREILEKQARWDDVVSLQKSILKREHSEKDKKREHENLIGYEYEYGRHSLENSQLEKAKKAFRSIMRAEKDFVPAILGLAEVLLQEGEGEEAVNMLENAFAGNESKILLARLEDLLISMSEPSRLIRIYRSGISRNPNDPVTKFFLGKLFHRLEMIDDSFDTLSGIDTGGASYPELHLLMGNLYMRKNQLEKAVQEFKKAADIKTAFRLPYCCNHCGYRADDWSGRCPDCRNWSTYQFNLDGTCKRA
ncbi:MAG: tetratricopeptide repeat protein [Nitrospirota bacterium]|nr:tetratricopeptide repeat protein [Nitrospirota bacterium]